MISLYVDNIIMGGNTRDEVQDLKKTIILVFGEAKFTMHKWNFQWALARE